MKKRLFKIRLNSLLKEDDEIIKDAKKFDCLWSVPYDFSDFVLDCSIEQDRKIEMFWDNLN
jgi:hypothetical protein